MESIKKSGAEEILCDEADNDVDEEDDDEDGNDNDKDGMSVSLVGSPVPVIGDIVIVVVGVASVVISLVVHVVDGVMCVIVDDGLGWCAFFACNCNSPLITVFVDEEKLAVDDGNDEENNAAFTVMCCGCDCNSCGWVAFRGRVAAKW